eukprot:PhF_6_TR29305/c0_g1_i1/m.42970
MQPSARALQDVDDIVSTSTISLVNAPVLYVEDIPDELMCGICHQAAVEAVITEECGHLYCNTCITAALEKRPECPMDRNPLTLQGVHKDVRSQRRIKELQVYCSNKAAGCTWKGAHNDRDRHIPKCDHNPIPCPFESFGCPSLCPRKAVAEHIQQSTQQHLVLLGAAMQRAQEDMQILQQQMEVLRRGDRQYVWIVPNFMNRKGPLYSAKFNLRGCLWYLGIDAEGPDQHAGVYLFAEGHSRRVDYKLTLYHAEESKDKVHNVADWRKDYKGKGWGPLKFIDRPNLAGSGFLVDGCIRIGLRMECEAYD